MLDGILGNFIELHAMHWLGIEHAALLQNLVQVPGYGLALAVGVGR